MHRLVKEEYYLIVTASSAVRLSELNFAIKKHNNKEHKKRVSSLSRRNKAQPFF
jgi:hypothetical protein